MGKANIIFIRMEESKRQKSAEFKFGRNGNFIIKSEYRLECPDAQDLMLEDMEKFLNNFFCVSYAKRAEEGFFFRFTNDKDEFRKIQAGEYTQSVNHADNRLERGISVSCDMSYIALGAYDYFYIVSGKVIGRGSDGEPILDAATMEKHSTYKSTFCYCKRAEKKQEENEEKFLKEYGWDVEQLRSLMCWPRSCKWQYINEDGKISDYSPWGSHPQKIFREGEFEALINPCGLPKIEEPSSVRDKKKEDI